MLSPYSRDSSTASDQSRCGNLVCGLCTLRHFSKRLRPRASSAGKLDFDGFFICRPYLILLLTTNMIAPTTNHVIHASRKDTVCRIRQSWDEAEVLREETGMSTEGTPRGRGPSTYTRMAEITSGRTITQQGLATTCKDLPYRENRSRWEAFGLAHGFVVARKVE